MEKILKPVSGFLPLIIALFLLAAGIYLLAHYNNQSGMTAIGIIIFIIAIFIIRGLTIIQPNNSVVLTFFGKYVGSLKENGLMFVNPFYSKQSYSLRVQNFESNKLKVNDKMGNPIEIAAVIVWQVNDTFKVAFEVVNYDQYVRVQSESAIRHLASNCPYDQLEDQSAQVTLRDGGEKVNAMLENELNDRLSAAGILVKESRITHLAYSPEIAGAMLQRQQATAVVAARFKIVEGAVGMVELALEELSKKQIVDLDEEKKAAMVSNLMVVLCGEKAATPVLNTGSLYQ